MLENLGYFQMLQCRVIALTMLCQGLVFTFVYNGCLFFKKSPFAPGKHIIASEELQFSTQAGDFLNKYLIYFGKHQHLNGNPSTSIKKCRNSGLVFLLCPLLDLSYFLICSCLASLSNNFQLLRKSGLFHRCFCSLKREERPWSAQYTASSWANSLDCKLSPAAWRHLRREMLMKKARLSAYL